MKKLIFTFISLLYLSSIYAVNTENHSERDLESVSKKSKEEIFFDLLADMDQTRLHNKTHNNQLLEKINTFIKEHLDSIDVNYQKEGSGFLHFLALFSNRYQKESLKILEELFKRGADISAQDSVGDSLLHKATYMRRRLLMEFLVENGALINLQNNKGQTPLNMIPYYPDSTNDIFLLENGADPNIPNKSGNYPLHIFMTELKRPAIEKSIELNAVLDKKNAIGKTPLDVLPPAEKRYDKYGKMHPVHQYIEMIQFLRKKGISHPYEEDHRGELAIYKLSQLELLKMLIKYEAVLDVKRLGQLDRRKRVKSAVKLIQKTFNVGNNIKKVILAPLRGIKGRK